MKGKKAVLITTLAMSSLMQAAMVIAPILAEIEHSFPDATQTQVQYVYTLTWLSSIVTGLLSGRLARRVNNYKLTVVGALFILFGGCTPFFLHGSLTTLYCCSAVIGFGTGIINVISSTLISENFSGIQRGTVMGFQSTVLSIGGVIFSTVGSQLSSHFTWHHAFLTYLIALPVLVILLLFSPRGTARAQVKENTPRVHMTKAAWTFVLLTLLSSVFVNSFNTYLAMFLSDTALGNVAAAGVAGAIFQAVGIPVGSLLGKAMKLLGKNLIWVLLLLMTLSFLLIASAQSIITIYVATVLYGISFSLFSPAKVTLVPGLVPEGGEAIAISTNQTLSSIGMFSTPVVVTAISSLCGGGARTPYYVSAVAMLLISGLYFFLNPIRPEQLAPAKD